MNKQFSRLNKIRGEGNFLFIYCIQKVIFKYIDNYKLWSS